MEASQFHIFFFDLPSTGTFFFVAGFYNINHKLMVISAPNLHRNDLPHSLSEQTRDASAIVKIIN